MSDRTLAIDSQEPCSCGTNENLVVTGISLVYKIDGKYAWSAECFECNEKFLLSDEACNELFGTEWRS